MLTCVGWCGQGECRSCLVKSASPKLSKPVLIYKYKTIHISNEKTHNSLKLNVELKKVIHTSKCLTCVLMT